MKKATTILQRIKLLNKHTDDSYTFNKTPFGNSVYKNGEPFLQNNNTMMCITLGGICFKKGLIAITNEIIV